MPLYQLTDDFTANADRVSFWRKLDGRSQFRVIADKFVQIYSAWVVRDAGGGYTRLWEYTLPQPELPPGERYEGGTPQKKVAFVVSPVEGHDGPAPVILVVNQTIAKEMFMHANELQGLTCADFVIMTSGQGVNKTYAVRTAPPSPLNPELAELGLKYDIITELK